MAIHSKCSDGTPPLSQAQIRVRYNKARQEKYEGYSSGVCECCGKEQGNDSDHTIAQARCKKLHKTQLIWHKGNFVWSCRKCHQEWENFKSGEWLKHKNVTERLAFLKEHDPEGFAVRVNFTRSSLEEQLG
jgi:hypothetical protein